jgi:hypothetical protein
MKFVGRIERDGQPAIRDVTGNYEFVGEPSEHQRFAGQMSLPVGKKIAVGMMYRLVCNNDLAAMVKIVGVSPDQQEPIVASFVGAGPFALSR